MPYVVKLRQANSYYRVYNHGPCFTPKIEEAYHFNVKLSAYSLARCLVYQSSWWWLIFKVEKVKGDE